MRVSVVVPWRGGACEHRRRAQQRTCSHLTGVFPHADLWLADDGGELWSSGGSIDFGVRQARRDLLVVCDSDVLVPARQLIEAVELAAAAPGLVTPFTSYCYLSEQTTAALLSRPLVPLAAWQRAWSYPYAVGACRVLSRETWELACGHDPRFRGWGCEDVAFYHATRTLAGEHRRIGGDALHLYHPPQPTNNDESPTYRANGDLAERYAAASGDADAMLALIAER